MFIITHALVPVVGAQLLRLALRVVGKDEPMRKREHGALMVAGMSPDLLSPHVSLDDRWSSPSHTIYFLLACLPVAIWSARHLPIGRPVAGAILLWFGVAMHLVGDALSGGIAWLHPWRSDIIGGRLISMNSWFAWDAWMILVVAGLGGILWLTGRACRRTGNGSKGTGNPPCPIG